MGINTLSVNSIIGIVSIFTLNSCLGIPKGATVVKPFNKVEYLGKWYEIARIDSWFEHNLNNTTAHYSVNADGSIRVYNRGYNFKTNKWKQVIGKAKFIGDNNKGQLKVSFFGPFYSSYNVIALDSSYKYALVAGKNLRYLWILSRETSIPEDIKQKYISIAKKLGYNTTEFIWVQHEIK